jgi:hypothetical protein
MVQIMQQSGQNNIIRQRRKLVRGKYIVNGKEKSSVHYCVLETGKRKGKERSSAWHYAVEKENRKGEKRRTV